MSCAILRVTTNVHYDMSTTLMWGISPLSSVHLKDIVQHFSRLDSTSLVYRFGANLSIDVIESFVGQVLHRYKDCCYGLWADGVLRAVVFMVPTSASSAEYAISLEKCIRHRGWAQELTNFAFDIAANRGISEVEIQFNTYNQAIKQLVSKYPTATIDQKGADTTKVVDLIQWELEFSKSRMAPSMW